MTLDEEIRRGEEAKRLMADPLMAEAFEKIEAGLIDGMKRCNLGDTKTQHDLVVTLQLFEQLKGHFREVIETGNMARLQKETLADRAKRALKRVI